jgi:hypothetical protein
VGSVLLALASTGMALGQISNPSPDARAIPAGPFTLYPTLSTEVELTDNLFFSTRDPLAATILRITPGILAQLPMRKSVFNLGYALQYKSYQGADLDDNLSHFFIADGGFNFGSGFAVTFSDDFQKGILDTQTFDPGGEVRFLGDEFTRNLFEVGLAHGRGRRNIGLTVGLGRLSFDDQQRLELAEPDAQRRVAGLFDTRSAVVRVFGESQRSARLWVVGEAVTRTADLSRIIRIFSEDPDVPPTDIPDHREQEVAEVGGEVRWALSPGAYLQGRLAYTDQQYVSKSEDLAIGNRTSSYRGLVGTATFSSAIPGRPRLALRGSRNVFPSVFLGNDYYISDRLSVLLESPARFRLRIGGEVTYFENDYPQSVPRREDNTVDGRLWFGYRVRSGLVWGVYARHTSRTSSLEILGFDATSYGVTFQLGG